MSTEIVKSNGGGKSSAIVSSGRGRLDNLRGLFDKAKGALGAVLPKHLPPEKVIRLVLSAASRTPDLLECTPESVLLAAMQSAALGLEPNTPLQHAYLIPYRNRKKGKDGVERSIMECQFIPGYRGLVSLALQSGEIKSVQARVVYDGDVFQVEYGLEEKLVHVPKLDGSREDKDIVAFYSVASFTSGAKTFEVMLKSDVDKIRKRSKASGFGPWVTDYAEMGKKTVIRRHSKLMPLSAEKSSVFLKALDHQGRAEDGAAPDYSEIVDHMGELGVGDVVAGVLPEASEETRTDATRERLAARAAAEQPSERQPGEDDQ